MYSNEMPGTNNIKSVAVFCGSRPGNDPLYAEHAVALGRLIGERGHMLVYGGGRAGMMGMVADAALEHGARVYGVIPEVLMAWEQQHEGITELSVVADMHVRKKMMYDRCDAVVVLPGGNGTLDELFELITWNSLKIHSKKVFLLNTAGFYDHLLAHFDRMMGAGFLYSDWRNAFSVHDSPETIFGKDGDKNQTRP